MTQFVDDSRFSIEDQDGETWFAKKDDDFKPDRKSYIERNFEEAYGRSETFKTITELVSRSKSLRKWYAITMEKFIIEIEVPQYYQEQITPEEYQSLSVEVNKYNNLNAKKSIEQMKISNKYKADMAAIDKTYNEKFNKLNENKLVKILTLTSEELPLGLQLKIQNYTPQDASDLRTSALYAREMLIRYKIELIKAAKNGEDVESLILANCEKF